MSLDNVLIYYNKLKHNFDWFFARLPLLIKGSCGNSIGYCSFRWEILIY